MILIDNRTGSKELHPLLNGIDRTLCRLEFGDVYFRGRGPDGGIGIAFERKTVHDLLSSMQSGKLSGRQIPGMRDDYDRVYVVLEGYWRPNPNDGTLEVLRSKWIPIELGNRRFTAREIVNYLNTLEVFTGIRWLRTQTLKETAFFIRSYYSWWNNKSFDKHKSHMSIHEPVISTVVKPSLKRRVAAVFDSIGVDRSKAVAEHFHNVYDMITAPVKEWEQIPGIGKKTAQSVYNAIRKDG